MKALFVILLLVAIGVELHLMASLAYCVWMLAYLTQNTSVWKTNFYIWLCLVVFFPVFVFFGLRWFRAKFLKQGQAERSLPL